MAVRRDAEAEADAETKAETDAEPDRTLVWERPEPPTRPAPSPLSRARIVQAAIELADADGLEAVSLRKVAAALNAGPMRLYGYLSTKEELLDLMVDAVYAEIAAPPQEAGTNWREALAALAHDCRRAALRHEWFADLLGGRPHLGPEALTILEASLAALYGAPGFADIDTVMAAASTVNSYVVGALRKEIAELRAERATGADEQAWQLAAAPYLNRMLATGRYPTLALAIRDASHSADPQATFTAGLAAVLDGVAPQRSD